MSEVEAPPQPIIESILSQDTGIDTPRFHIKFTEEGASVNPEQKKYITTVFSGMELMRQCVQQPLASAYSDLPAYSASEKILPKLTESIIKAGISPQMVGGIKDMRDFSTDLHALQPGVGDQTNEKAKRIEQNVKAYQVKLQQVVEQRQATESAHTSEPSQLNAQKKETDSFASFNDLFRRVEARLHVIKNALTSMDGQISLMTDLGADPTKVMPKLQRAHGLIQELLNFDLQKNPIEMQTLRKDIEKIVNSLNATGDLPLKLNIDPLPDTLMSKRIIIDRGFWSDIFTDLTDNARHSLRQQAQANPLAQPDNNIFVRFSVTSAGPTQSVTVAFEDRGKGFSDETPFFIAGKSTNGGSGRGMTNIQEEIKDVYHGDLRRSNLRLPEAPDKTIGAGVSITFPLAT